MTILVHTIVHWPEFRRSVKFRYCNVHLITIVQCALLYKYSNANLELSLIVQCDEDLDAKTTGGLNCFKAAAV